MAKQRKKNKPAKSKKKKFSTPDYVAIAIFALIIAVIIGSVVFYYGMYRPQVSRTVSERAEEFTEAYFEYDYRDEDYSFDTIYEYLTPNRLRVLQPEADRILRNRKGTELVSQINELQSEVVNISWDEAEVLVTFEYTQETITQDRGTDTSTIRYSFKKIGDEWLIDRYEQE